MVQAVAIQNKSSRRNSYSSVAARGPMLDRVYSLRYKSYSEEGYIDKCSSKKFMDEYDSMPNCTSYLTYSDKEIIGSIRSCVYTPGSELYIPVMDVFKREMDEHVDMTKPVIETNKFVIDPRFQRRGGVKARLAMFQNIFLEALEHKAESIVIAVRPEHVKFYKIMYFSQISEAKSYPLLSFDTVLLKCESIDKGYEFFGIDPLVEKAS